MGADGAREHGAACHQSWAEASAGPRVDLGAAASDVGALQSGGRADGSSAGSPCWTSLRGSLPPVCLRARWIPTSNRKYSTFVLCRPQTGFYRDV